MNKLVKIDAEMPERISVEELDRRFDDGEDVSAYFDWSKVRRPGLEIKRVSIGLPDWMLQQLDHRAADEGVTRQALIETWLTDRLKAIS